MHAKRALRWAGTYVLFAGLATVVGLGLVAAGAVVAGSEALAAYESGGAAAALRAALPGLVPALLGVLVWRLGVAWALYRTFAGALSEELSDTYDTERVKSEVLSVLDERLSEMQNEVSATQGEVRSLREAVEAAPAEELTDPDPDARSGDERGRSRSRGGQG